MVAAGDFVPGGFAVRPVRIPIPHDRMQLRIAWSRNRWRNGIENQHRAVCVRGLEEGERELPAGTFPRFELASYDEQPSRPRQLRMSPGQPPGIITAYATIELLFDTEPAITEYIHSILKQRCRAWQHLRGATALGLGRRHSR
jgi:hypothetical protein